jgi:methylated-DNA-[protein]-cysteine S-methyltransferase
MKEMSFSLPFLGGSVAVTERDGAVYRVYISSKPAKGTAPRTNLAADMKRYLAGERVSFEGYKVDYSGYTEFQRRVLEATRKIPQGEIRSYGEVAEAAGRPGAARAVGSTMANNRICIIVPCHRVVAMGGVGGFSGSLGYKIAMLELEGVRKDRWLTGRYSKKLADGYRRKPKRPRSPD